MSSVASSHAATGTERAWPRAWPLNRPAVTGLVGGGVVLLAVWTVIGLLYTGLLDDGPVGDADRRVSRWLEDRRTPTWNTVSGYGSMMSETLVKVVLVAVVGTTMILVWRRWHDGVFLAVAVIVESSAFALASLIVGRDRPPVEQLDTIPISGSFPSGHTAAAVTFYLGVYVVARWHTTNRAARGVLLTVGIVVPIAVAASRVQRGMHHVSDVIGGYTLGLATLVVVHAALAAGVRELDRRSDDGLPYPEHTRELRMARATPSAGHVTSTERAAERPSMT